MGEFFNTLCLNSILHRYGEASLPLRRRELLFRGSFSQILVVNFLGQVAQIDVFLFGLRHRADFSGDEAELFLKSQRGKIHFNLWETNRYLLEQAGVGQIEVSGLCTACHTADWFSHRAEKGRTGRFGALISLV